MAFNFFFRISVFLVKAFIFTEISIRMPQSDYKIIFNAERLSEKLLNTIGYFGTLNDFH